MRNFILVLFLLLSPFVVSAQDATINFDLFLNGTDVTLETNFSEHQVGGIYNATTSNDRFASSSPNSVKMERQAGFVYDHFENIEAISYKLYLDIENSNVTFDYGTSTSARVICRFDTSFHKCEVGVPLVDVIDPIFSGWQDVYIDFTETTNNILIGTTTGSFDFGTSSSQFGFRHALSPTVDGFPVYVDDIGIFSGGSTSSPPLSFSNITRVNFPDNFVTGTTTPVGFDISYLSALPEIDEACLFFFDEFYNHLESFDLCDTVLQSGNLNFATSTSLIDETVLYWTFGLYAPSGAVIDVTIGRLLSIGIFQTLLPPEDYLQTASTSLFALPSYFGLGDLVLSKFPLNWVVESIELLRILSATSTASSTPLVVFDWGNLGMIQNVPTTTPIDTEIVFIDADFWTDVGAFEGVSLIRNLIAVLLWVGLIFMAWREAIVVINKLR